MSSRRFPGKVLTYFLGKPLLRHVYDHAVQAGICDAQHVVVLTSSHSTDNAVEAYCRNHDIECWRGPLENVLGRFAGAVERHGGKSVIRLTADSPLVPVELMRFFAPLLHGSAWDLITTTHCRTLPKGMNIEAFTMGALTRALEAGDLSDLDREHVTPYFHRHPEKFSICHVGLRSHNYSALDYAVDNPEDLARIEASAGEVLAAMPWDDLEAQTVLA
jgi:spore coat polysaccharide biosynthesis protein SpsF (cytidylyltransferase family)